jgi:predicted transcriptional regulator
MPKPKKRPLTAKQLEIAKLARKGFSQKEIAEKMGVAASCVSVSLKSTKDRLPWRKKKKKEIKIPGVPVTEKKEAVVDSHDILSDEEISERIKDLQRQEILNLQKIKHYEDTHGSQYFKPFEYQERFLDLITAGKKVSLIQGANQIGKTLIGCILVDTFANCRQAFEWKDKALENVFGNRPVRIRIVASDWEHHANEVIVPKLKEIVTAGTYQTKKNNVGVEAFWQFKTGSTIEIMTHSQETKIHEGWTGDVVWSDEPLPHDKFIANRRGLIARGGLFFMTMTAITEPWIMDEIVLNNKKHIGAITEVPMRANKTLSEDEIQAFEDDCPADQKTARVGGGWLQLVGRVLKSYDKDIHIIDSFTIPTDWPVTPFIDIHLNKPQAISFYAVDKHGRHYVIDEIWEHLSPEELADEIIRKKMVNQWNIDTAFIDPLSKGDSAYIKNRGMDIEDSFNIIADRLADDGIELIAASKDKKSGIINLNAWLLGVNKMPTLFFFDSLPSYDGAYGHLYEIVRWVYDKEGLPAKLNDHFMENMYRYTLAGVEYSEQKGNYCHQVQKQGSSGKSSQAWMV